MGAFAPGNRRYLVPQLMQQSDCGAADAAAGPGNYNFAIFRTNSGIFQRHHAQHGGEARGTNGHGFTPIQSLRHCYQPVAFNASAFRQTAPVVFANAPSGEQHLLARMKARIFAAVDRTGKIAL